LRRGGGLRGGGSRGRKVWIECCWGRAEFRWITKLIKVVVGRLICIGKANVERKCRGGLRDLSKLKALATKREMPIISIQVQINCSRPSSKPPPFRISHHAFACPLCTVQKPFCQLPQSSPNSSKPHRDCSYECEYAPASIVPSCCVTINDSVRSFHITLDANEELWYIEVITHRRREVAVDPAWLRSVRKSLYIPNG
jgi:hypothetical protein